MSVMDLSSVVLDFSSSYNVTRSSSPGEYVDGKFVAASTSTFAVQAMVHPLEGRELERLPEGLRAKELLAVFTVAALKVEAPGVRPDTLAIDSENWQVEKVERWATLGNFHRSIVSKVP